MQQPLSLEAIVALTTKAAESFVEAYYNALDAEQPHRATAVAALYAPTCRISWNGNPIPYNDLPAFLTQLPKSVHEVQAFDCHPIPGSATSPNSPPAIIVSVTGQVAPFSLRPSSQLITTLQQVTHGDNAAVSTVSTNSKDFPFLPRVFSQSFILAFDPRIAPTNPGDSPRYAISSDAFRFVG